MPKLAKNMYTTAKGERKLNCYVIHISKEVVEQTNIKENDNVVVCAENNKIVIKKGE